MNTLEIKGKWNQIKGTLKEKYGELTEDDLVYLEGQEDKLLGKLQAKTGKTKEQIAKEINALAN